MEKNEASRLCCLLYQPVASHFTSIYVTLLSVVQAGALSILAYYALTANSLTAWQIIHFLISGLVILTVWHAYATYAQYVAWPISIVDSFIPFAFFVSESVLAKTASVSDTSVGVYWFQIVIMIIYFWGAAAYLNAAYGRIRSDQYLVLREYYRGNGLTDELANIAATCVTNTLQMIDRRGFLLLFGFAILTLIASHCVIPRLDDSLQPVVSGVVQLGLIVILLTRWSVHKELKRQLVIHCGEEVWGRPITLIEGLKGLGITFVILIVGSKIGDNNDNTKVN